ncbi:gamma-aminobutyric acid receptor subunit pi [Eublepharis macularius]|uniref:Gamma-aminobutyric acid receptor subunit pi n=1 Tax=Eublepharis macularius TaxID=481883 RepID=A0AA97KZF5_EUBMA|nr:gamma-aminobutyric acid receptor subunit pi [Eublepharis macularius]
MCCSYYSSISVWLFLLFQGKFILGHRVDSNTENRVTSSLPGFGNLTQGYNKYLRPDFGGKPVMIAMSVNIASISSISESDMDYTATIYLRQCWTDPRLVFKGNKSFTLDARLVKYLWVPDTYIVDSKRSFLHEVTVENRLIRLFSNGTVLYALRITTTVACNMDLSKYPLDTQTCKLQLESWGYDESDILFTWIRGNDSVRGLDNLRLSQYTVERYYTFETRSQQETGSYPRLIVQFELKRNILYFILETYVPSTLLVVLSWVSFWITLDSVPARTCIGVTTVLSMTTLMMGSRNSITKTNGFIKAIDVYLGICFSFIFGALVEYAFAHYITSQKGTANKPQKDSTNNVLQENGDISIVDVLNTSVSSYSKKLNFPTFDNVNCGGLAMNPKDKIRFIMKNKMRKVHGYFTIHNPSNIDHYSKLLFPLFFMMVNLLYWAYYLCF